MKSIFRIVILLLLAVGVSFAQDGPTSPAKGSTLSVVSFPGSGWSSTGALSPAEHGNVQSQSYFEQGVTIFRRGSFSIDPYVSLGIAADTKGYDWNNKTELTGGLKLNKLFRNGIVSVGGGYAYEDRFLSGSTAGSPIGYVQDWFGWNPVANKKSRFPGSTWGILGNISPVEKKNVIAVGYLNQGVVVKRFGYAALIPYGEGTLSADTQGFDWERRGILGAGVKAALPLGNTYFELGAGYLHENRFISGTSANGLKVFLNASLAWRLFGKR